MIVHHTSESESEYNKSESDNKSEYNEMRLMYGEQS